MLQSLSKALRSDSLVVSCAGILVSADSYFNFQLADSEEIIDGTVAGNLGEILIRCNNVLYIKEVEE